TAPQSSCSARLRKSKLCARPSDLTDGKLHFAEYPATHFAAPVLRCKLGYPGAECEPNGPVRVLGNVSDMVVGQRAVRFVEGLPSVRLPVQAQQATGRPENQNATLILHHAARYERIPIDLRPVVSQINSSPPHPFDRIVGGYPARSV